MPFKLAQELNAAVRGAAHGRSQARCSSNIAIGRSLAISELESIKNEYLFHLPSKPAIKPVDMRIDPIYTLLKA